MPQVIFKIKQGRYVKRVPLEMEEEGRHIIFRGGFAVKDDIKAMAGARWNPEEKCWTVSNNKRNWWWIAYLLGENPYLWYDKPLINYVPEPRLCYRCQGKGCQLCGQTGRIKHFRGQIEAIQHGITRKGCIIAAEMGLGKTLSAYEIIEYAYLNEGKENWLFCAPRSALASVKLERMRWRTKGNIEYLTYEAMKKVADIANYDGIIFDEASRIKNPTAQRSQAAKILVDRLREKSEHPYIILMSGTPAPKSPADWWHLCELAKPGFIKEGTIEKFKKRLGLIVQKENTLTGGIYPELITWWDNEDKCAECGEPKDNPVHSFFVGDFHTFKKSENEVAKLYRRMKGLVIVQTKKDYLDLPEKRYEVIKLTPDRATLNAYDMIKAKATRAIQILTLSRELADGFQYRIVEEGDKWCPLCKGIGEVSSSIAPKTENRCPYCDFPVNPEQINCNSCEEYIGDIEFQPVVDNEGDEVITCPQCSGTKKVPKKVRKAIEVATPKIQVVKDLLDQHEDVGRFIIYAGFMGSIDRLKKVIKEADWEYIKVDGRGWESSISSLQSDVERIQAFQDGQSKYEKICFIAHPQSGGMGLNLTSSPGALFYSNDFNYESRAQAEDRGHRPGMDINRGFTIYDISYLPIDDYVRENLLKKKKLQGISLGELERVIK